MSAVWVVVAAVAFNAPHGFRFGSEARSCSGVVMRESDDLDLVLRELEGLRDWVNTDVAAAAMQAVREKRSLDAFISELQDEVWETGDEISSVFELTALSLEEQAEAAARERRSALAQRAEALLEELEASAPAAFKRRGASVDPPSKSPFLPSGATIVIAGVRSSTFGTTLTDGLEAMGHDLRFGPAACTDSSANPNLPPSPKLRSEYAGADAIVLVCDGVVQGGVSSTYLRGNPNPNPNPNPSPNRAQSARPTSRVAHPSLCRLAAPRLLHCPHARMDPSPARRPCSCATHKLASHSDHRAKGGRPYL